MCVIIYKPVGVDIAGDIFQKAFIANPDGCGLAIKKNEDLYVLKGIMFSSNIEVAMNSLLDVIKVSLKEVELVIHFRLASSGRVTENLTHPFVLSKNPDLEPLCWYKVQEPVLFHNGTILSFTKHDRNTSDTRELAIWLGNLISYCKEDLSKYIKLILKPFTVTNKFAIVYPGKTKTQLLGSWVNFSKDGIKATNLFWNFDCQINGLSFPKYSKFNKEV